MTNGIRMLLYVLLSGVGTTQLLCQSKIVSSGTIPSPHKETLQGLVRDLACPIMNPKATSTNFDVDCALSCAKAGSPLIILSQKGLIYFPISGDMPDVSQREKLMPLIGKHVSVSGTIYERAGTRAIVISSIHEVAGVKTTDHK